MKANLIFDAGATLGEGAVWNHRQQTLWWVDIEKGLLHIFDPSSGKDQSYEMGQRIGTVVPAADGTAIVALQDGIYSFDLSTRQLTFRSRPENHGDNLRFNDGKCDPSGRLWAGSMGLGRDISSRAFLYRFDQDFTANTMLDGITISNGICWSVDKKRMYYIDTPTQQVKEFEFDDQSGSISFSRVAVEIPRREGHPDGMCIDADGNLWIALWGGSAVCCYDPVSGIRLHVISVPVPNVTSCAFGDKDLKTIYITTASTKMEKKDMARYPRAGGMFSARLDIKGVQTPFFQTGHIKP